MYIFIYWNGKLLIASYHDRSALLLYYYWDFCSLRSLQRLLASLNLKVAETNVTDDEILSLVRVW